MNILTRNPENNIPECPKCGATLDRGPKYSFSKTIVIGDKDCSWYYCNNPHC
jgi:hypothetical protein